MKKVLVLSIFSFCVLFAQAKIWRVNNNVGVTADFTTIQAAHDAAAPGDSIYIEGSSNNYGSLSCGKKLYIVGPGYFLDQVPNTQVVLQTAKVSSIYLYAGSEGTVIMGLDFQGSGTYIYCNNIVIKRNLFSYLSSNDPAYYGGPIYLNSLNNGSTPVSNIIISQNYGLYINVSYSSTGVLITNNVLTTNVSYNGNNGQLIFANPNATLLVQNNVFLRGTINTFGCTYTNNIMVDGVFNVNTNLFSNNLANGSQFGTDNGNQANITMSSVFNYTGSYDQWYKLKTGSPAIGAGYGSTVSNPIDCGIYGGNTPYVVAGQVNMPAIYYFANQGIGSNTDPIKVTVKVKAAGN